MTVSTLPRRPGRLNPRLQAVAGVLNRAHAELVEITAEALRTEAWAEAGVVSPTHWLVLRAGLSRGRATAVLAAARRREELPVTFGMFDAGVLSLEQVGPIVRRVPAAFEASVAELAQFATVPQIDRAIRCDLSLPDPEADSKPGDEGSSDPGAQSGGSPEGSATVGPTPVSATEGPTTRDDMTSADGVACGGGDASDAADEPDPARDPDSSSPDSSGPPSDSSGPPSDSSGPPSESSGPPSESSGTEAPSSPSSSGAPSDPPAPGVSPTGPTPPISAAFGLDGAGRRPASEVPDRWSAHAQPATLTMHHDDAGRFHLHYEAPSDVGALVENAVRESTDALWHLLNPTSTTASATPTPGRSADASSANSSTPRTPASTATAANSRRTSPASSTSETTTAARGPRSSERRREGTPANDGASVTTTSSAVVLETDRPAENVDLTGRRTVSRPRTIVPNGATSGTTPDPTPRGGPNGGIGRGVTPEATRHHDRDDAGGTRHNPQASVRDRDAGGARHRPQASVRVTLAEGFEQLARRNLAGVESPSRRDSYRVYVHLDAQGGWLTGRPRLPGHLVDKLSCDARLQPVWQEDGVPVSVGRTQRTIPNRTRRLVLDRDRGCRVPGCGATRGVDVHHIVHWAHGGPTDLANLVTLCSRHHDALHRGDFTITGDPNRDDAPPGAPSRPGEGLRFVTRHGLPLGPVPPAPTTGPLPTGAPYAGPTGETLQTRWVTFAPTRRAG